MPKGKRYVRRIAYVLVLAVAGLVMIPNPVHAAYCPSNLGSSPPMALTLWEDDGFCGNPRFFLSGEVLDLDLWLYEFGDKASSIVNKTNTYWLLYDDANFRDRAMCIRPHSYYRNLANAGFNDKTSSLKQRGMTNDTCDHWPIIGIPDSFCGDGLCGEGETCSYCASDCGGCPPPPPTPPPSDTQCLVSASPAGFLSLWEDTSCNGDRFEVPLSIIYDLDPDPPFGFGDMTSSVVNKTNSYWLLHDDTGLRDRAMCIAPNSHYSNMADAGFNDKTSSLIRQGATEDTCNSWPIIGIPNFFCGDGLCGAGETCSNCASDCGGCSPPPPPPPPPPPCFPNCDGNNSQCEPYQTCQVFCLIGVSEPIGPDFCGCSCDGFSECPICLL